MADRALFVYRT